MIKKIINAITSFFESSSRSQIEKIVGYFERKHHARRNILLSHHDLTKHLSETISSFEIVGCLTIYLGSKSMPIDTLIERDILHPSWINNFDEAFFLALEQTARDFRIRRWDIHSQRLLKFGQYIAGKVGRNEWAQKFHERLVRGIKGFYAQHRT